MHISITCNGSCPNPLELFVSDYLDEIEFADLEFIERVGRGGSGCVWKGLWKSRNMTVAIKRVIDLPETEVSL